MRKIYATSWSSSKLLALPSGYDRRPFLSLFSSHFNGVDNVDLYFWHCYILRSVTNKEKIEGMCMDPQRPSTIECFERKRCASRTDHFMKGIAELAATW